MDRRAFLAGSVGFLAAPLAAEAQPAGKVPRIGVLLAGSPGADTQYVVEAFGQGLRGLGYAEGRNITVEYRYAGGRLDRSVDQASQLIRLPVDVIVAPGTAVAQAARKATATIAIVIVTAGNPVGDGLIKSFARPGGNVTGLTMAVDQQMGGKLLELLKEAVPTVSRVAILWNPLTAPHMLAVKETEAAARTLGLVLEPVKARRPDEIEGTFAAISRGGALMGSSSWRTRCSCRTGRASPSWRPRATCRRSMSSVSMWTLAVSASRSRRRCWRGRMR